MSPCTRVSAGRSIRRVAERACGHVEPASHRQACGPTANVGRREDNVGPRGRLEKKTAVASLRRVAAPQKSLRSKAGERAHGGPGGPSDARPVRVADTKWRGEAPSSRSRAARQANRGRARRVRQSDKPHRTPSSPSSLSCTTPTSVFPTAWSPSLHQPLLATSSSSARPTRVSWPRPSSLPPPPPSGELAQCSPSHAPSRRRPSSRAALADTPADTPRRRH